MTLNSLNPPCTLTTSKPFVAVLGVHTFGPDNSNPTRPMSFPNYSDPLVANWSSGQDSITLTPSIFDAAMLGTYGPLKVYQTVLWDCIGGRILTQFAVQLYNSPL